MAKVDTKSWITELGQQLEVSETRCESIKSQLSYMKNLYQGFPEEPSELKSQGYSPRLSKSNANSDFSHGSNEFKEFLKKEKIQMNSYMNDIEQMHCMVEETIVGNLHTAGNLPIDDNISTVDKLTTVDNLTTAGNLPTAGNVPAIGNIPTIGEAPKPNREKSIKSARISPEITNSDFLNKDKKQSQSKMSNVMTESQRIIFSPRKKENESYTGRVVSDEILEINLDRNLAGSCSQMRKSARRHIIEIPITADREEQTDIREFQNEQMKELILNLSRSMESTQTNKKKKISKSDKNCYRKAIVNKSLSSRRKSNGKMDESIVTIAKVRKKKGRLRSVNSKSTIGTRDTSLTDRRDPKRKKNKSCLQKTSQSLTSHRQRNQETSGKSQQNWSEVVELYHNLAVKSGSLSVVSSKHSRLDPHFQESLHGTLSTNNYNKKFESRPKDVKQFETKQKLQNLDTFEEENISTKTAKENCKEENFVDNETNPYLQSYPGSKFYDPMMVRNYEQPTVSSKLKRVQRSYFNRFNFRNIPFVVGTSISPSHNLGLNIQQVLSIMKAKQSRPSGITPLLIRKVSQGIRPMTSLLSQISSRNGFPDQSKTQFPSAHRISSCQQNYLTMQQNYNNRNTCETLYEEKEENDWNELKENSGIKESQGFKNKIINGKKFNSQGKISHSSFLKQKEMEFIMGDQNLSYQNVSNNSKGIRDVFLKLHNQFEEMNTRYEKLEEKAEKYKDKSLKKEMEKLDAELTAKEEEIKAVVGLYAEVMALKKQMKMMAERNSFVCVSTESSKPCPIISHFKNSRVRSSNGGNIREASTGTRLTGLLRQIQMFQRQLKQTS